MEWTQEEKTPQDLLDKMNESASIELEIYLIVSEVEEQKSTFSQLYRYFQEKSSYILDAFMHEEEINQEQRIELRHELNAFREAHGISKREAFYPKSYILHFAWIFVFIFIESLINAYFFGEASSLGLLGGVLIGFVTSFFNVTLSTIAGYMLRFKNHMSEKVKSIGYWSFGIVLFFILFLHLFIAHYREVLSVHPHVEIGSVLEPFLSNPFGLHSMDSLVLIALGFLITFFSILKGLNLDDAYPGYGAIYRRWRVREDAFLASKRQARALVRDLHSLCLKKSDEIIDKMLSLKKRLELIEKGTVVTSSTERILNNAFETINPKIEQVKEAQKRLEEELIALKESYLNSSKIMEILHQVKSNREITL